MFPSSSSTWWRIWKQRIQQPVLGELRVDIERIGDIDIRQDTFQAKVLVYCRVEANSIYESWEERVTEPNQTYVLWDGLKIEEYSPLLEFEGSITTRKYWVREKEKSGRLVFCYEVDGEFDIGAESYGSWYPFDYHALGLKITSSWDSERFLIVPWNGGWAVEDATSSIQRDYKVVDRTCCRIRNALISDSLHHTWAFTHIPQLTIGSTKGFAGEFVYSHAKVSMFVSRRAMYFFIYDIVRPLSLALLAPVSLSTISGIDGRITYNVSIILSMSFGFSAGNQAKRVTFSDYYKVAMFVFASIVLLIAIFPDSKNFIFSLGAWGIFGVIHSIFVAAFLWNYPTRRRLWHEHQDRPSNDLDYILKAIRHGLASITRAKDAGSRQKIQIDFGDED